MANMRPLRNGSSRKTTQLSTQQVHNKAEQTRTECSLYSGMFIRPHFLMANMALAAQLGVVPVAQGRLESW